MPSTYSSNLRLELIGTGEQAGTWGTTTNTNLGTLIEQAIAGYATVTITDANYTLTTVNGASDEARSMGLNIVSSVTLTATRNVICPSVSKLYVVRNATTGGQSIVIKTSAGSGITIPNGATNIVFCNGTDVIDPISGKQNTLGYTPVNKAGDTMTGLLTLSADPSTALQAATKQYVDTGLATKQAALGYTPVNKAGDTMTGQLTLPGGGAGSQAATVSQITAAQAGAVAKAGDTMTGQLTLPGGGSGSQAATVSQITAAQAGAVAKAGDTMTGQLNLTATNNTPYSTAGVSVNIRNTSTTNATYAGLALDNAASNTSALLFTEWAGTNASRFAIATNPGTSPTALSSRFTINADGSFSFLNNSSQLIAVLDASGNLSVKGNVTAYAAI